jgi:hypothetical protein
MTRRPKYNPHPDKNHHVVAEAVEQARELPDMPPIYAVDVSKRGGVMVDWLVWVGQRCVAIEVKSLEKLTRFEPGEIEFLTNCPGIVGVVTTINEALYLITLAARVPEYNASSHKPWVTFGIPADHEITKERIRKWLQR